MLVTLQTGSAAFEGSVPRAPLSHVPPPGDADGWRLLSVDDGFAGVGGSGEIFGTTGDQYIVIFGNPGAIVLDPSFNRGGDFIQFEGDASEWQVALSGTFAVFFNQGSYVQVPVGPGGTTIAFDDGQYELRFDVSTQTVLIGDQQLLEEYFPVTATGDDLVFPEDPFDPSRVGDVIFNEGGELALAGFFDVFGTDASEVLILVNGEYTLDPSFNKGGDTIGTIYNAETFEAQLNGSSVVLENNPVLVTIPVGPNAIDLIFADAREDLRYDIGSQQVLIGDQVITADAAPLMIA